MFRLSLLTGVDKPDIGLRNILARAGLRGEPAGQPTIAGINRKYGAS
jgi:hypothetical protein